MTKNIEMKIPILLKPNTTLANKTGAWRTLKPVFLQNKCTACSICQNFCPEGIIYQTDKTNSSGRTPYAFDNDYCKGCGLCAEVCPFKAIVMELDQK
jgi:pyruvate ferredoxin oxidoreductase delta subunit